MPTISADRLLIIASKLLQSAGANSCESEIVARHCVDANLAGHDSHGIMQIPVYIDRMIEGHISPGAKLDIVKETSTTIVADGNWGFGYVVSERVMEITIEKAAEHNVGAATIFRQSHVGRVTDYPLMAAKAGMIGMMTADSGRTSKSVVPFGGREPRLGTNPICIAMPSDLDGPMFIDGATSAVAAGKIAVAVARQQSIPEGWIVDPNGNPTTDPEDFGRGGALLPLGGAEGHKGYGLSAMVEIFSGILTGLGYGYDTSGRHNDGCFMAVFKVDAFRPLADFKREVADFAAYLKSSPPATGFTEVYYPGELEYISSKRLMVEGINVEDRTWSKLVNLATEYGIASELQLACL